MCSKAETWYALPKFIWVAFVACISSSLKIELWTGDEEKCNHMNEHGREIIVNYFSCVKTKRKKNERKDHEQPELWDRNRDKEGEERQHFMHVCLCCTANDSFRRLFDFLSKCVIVAHIVSCTQTLDRKTFIIFAIYAIFFLPLSLLLLLLFVVASVIVFCSFVRSDVTSRSLFLSL